MPKLKTEETIHRQNRVLDAAERCFTRLGTQRTTMRDIFAEAGVSAGGTYVHFRSKADIIEVLARRSSERDVSVIRTCVVAGDPGATLANFFKVAFADWRGEDARDGVRLDVGMWAEALHNKPVARLLRRSADRLLDALAGALAEADGVDTPSPGHLVGARIAAAIVLGVSVEWHADAGFDPHALEHPVTALAPAIVAATR